MITTILAGGKSSRFGSDKLTVPVQGKILLQHIADTCRPYSTSIWLSGRLADGLNGFDKSLADYPEKSGPLSGIYSILNEGNHSDLFIVAGDYPNLSQDGLNWFFNTIQQSDGICIPQTPDGFKHVLHTFLPFSILSQLRFLQPVFQRESVIGFFEQVPHKIIPVPEHLTSHFFNMNFKEDYHSIR